MCRDACPICMLLFLHMGIPPKEGPRIYLCSLGPGSWCLKSLWALVSVPGWLSGFTNSLIKLDWILDFSWSILSSFSEPEACDRLSDQLEYSGRLCFTESSSLCPWKCIILMALGHLKPVCFPILLCQSKCVSVGMPASFSCEDWASGTQGTVVAANW